MLRGFLLESRPYLIWIRLAIRGIILRLLLAQPVQCTGKPHSPRTWVDHISFRLSWLVLKIFSSFLFIFMLYISIPEKNYLDYLAISRSIER